MNSSITARSARAPTFFSFALCAIAKDYVEKKGSPVITLRGCIGIGSTENPQIAASN